MTGIQLVIAFRRHMNWNYPAKKKAKDDTEAASLTMAAQTFRMLIQGE